jgi:hypothetical protein
MSHSATSPAPAESAPASTTAATRLHGRWLALARIGCVAVAGLGLALFVGGLPAHVAAIEAGCRRTAVCHTNQVWLNALQNLHTVGFSFAFLAWCTVVLYGLLMVVYAVVGLVLFWRRAADPTALVAAFALFTFPITLTNVTSALPAFLWLPDQVVNWLGGSALFLLLYLFPAGRFVPRWSRWLWAGIVLAFGGQVFWPSAPFHLLLEMVALAGLAVSGVAVQLYRYARVSTPVERQQTKWVVIGVSVALTGMLFGTALTRSFPGPLRGHIQLYVLVFGVFYLSPLLIPLSFAFAILRYRLWDIDALINKALVYGLLTGLLGALYAGLILGLESLAGLFGGTAAQNPVVLVISTLAIAALFLPLRRRIQSFIDRRFYRKRYDAEKTLGAFSAALKNEVDLEQIRELLMAVVQPTMQPAHVSLWLRPPERRSTEQTHRLEPLGPAPTKLSSDYAQTQPEEKTLGPVR